jgi:hypothetical protein
MKRTQFLVLVSLSSLVFLFLALQAGFAIWSQKIQYKIMVAQQIVQQGRACDQRWRQLIGRVAEVSQKSQDQGLKDILSRQGVTIKINPDASSTPNSNPAPAPANPAPSNP